MQKTVSFTINKKKYVSKPFDFEAFCLISELAAGEKTTSIFRCAKPAVEYMFEGTEATDDVLKSLDVSVMAKMCKKVWDMYSEAVTVSVKNE